MFVPAPRRSTPGTTVVTQVAACRAGGGSYLTVADAMLDADVLNQFTTFNSGLTTRGLMESGILDFRRYKNTDYSASYRRSSSVGRVITALFGGLYYQSINNAMVEQPITGFFGNGVIFNVDSLEDFTNSAIMTNLMNQAKTECLIKAKDQKFDVSESLTGMKQTVVLLAERTEQLLRSFNAVRKGNIPAALGALGLRPVQLKRFRGKDAASIWLELQYGWLPLVSDIYDAFNTVRDLIAPAGPAKDQFTVVRRLTTPLFLADPFYDTPSWVSAVLKSEAQGWVEVRYRFRINDPTAHLLSSLELLNPAYVAWVATPYSFVLDWLLPVSTVLQAMSAHIGLQFTDGYTSSLTWGKQSCQASTRNTGFYIKMLEVGSTTATAERLNMRRVALSDFPLASLYFRFPFHSNTRIANAIALVGASRKWH